MEFRTHTSLDEIPATQWDALHDGSNPFVAHAFLHGLERAGCLRPHWGWAPLHAALWEGNELIAAAPGYIKGNSHGEFVFDHAWAAAIERAGRDYYPKWLFAIPYTPVTGPRWLAKDRADRTLLAELIAESARRLKLSSVHANFLADEDNEATPASWLERSDMQFHWRNDAGWRCFDDYLGAMLSKKRKNIRHERRQAREAGIAFRIVHGDEASAQEVADMHALYLRAFADKGNSPALTLEFFEHLATAMPRQLVIVLAQRCVSERSGSSVVRQAHHERDPRQAHHEREVRQAHHERDPRQAHKERHAGVPEGSMTIAGALFLRGGDTLYGRYWGCFEEVPGLHFETCYYQGIEYCLREGLRVFEPGAQGEHKIARGFLPVTMHSRHHFTEPGLDQAFARWCDEERAANERYRLAVLAHSPYRDVAAR
ncbi:MAG TPA: GNAT family N-acetyltransferase [Xanthomonadaceae bacterium]